MTRDITAPAHLVMVLVDIRSGTGKKVDRQIRPTLGLFSVRFGPTGIYYQNGTFSYTSYRFFFNAKTFFCAMLFESWETFFGTVVLHGNMQRVTPGPFFPSFFVRRFRSKLQQQKN